MLLSTTYRADIDGLRAVAVGAVVVYHYFGFLTSGYLGVDVFFVISGYVITSYLLGAEKSSWLDFLLTFYGRRIKRLTPALVACVVFTAVLFALVTTHAPREAFTSGAWALAGVSNVYLLEQSENYFALDAQLNPFTHTWSLGVEEQFYLLYPALIGLVGYSWRARHPTPGRAAAALSLLSAVSLGLFLALPLRSATAAFYLMPARFWELGAGGLTYLATTSGLKLKAGWFANFCMVGLVGCFMAPSNGASIATPVCVVLSALLLFVNARVDSIVSRSLSSATVVAVGRRSYSIYLWHWTILVVGKWTFGDSATLSAILLALAVAMACASYAFVEEPLRRADWARAKLGVLAIGVVTSALAYLFVDRVVASFAKHYDANLPALFSVRPPEEWAPNPCNGRAALGKLQDPLTFCLAADRTAEKPHALYLLGDSHAAQLFNMSKLAMAKLPFSPRFINLEDANEFVVGFTRGVRDSKMLDYVLANARRGDVVAIAFFRGHLNPSRDRQVPLGASVSLGKFGSDFVAAMNPYVDKLVEAGIPVILAADTPQMSVVAPSSSCALQIRLFGSSICRVSKAQDLQSRKRQDLAFESLREKHPDSVFVWDPLDELYAGLDQFDVLDDRGGYAMLDWNHLTEARAAEMAPSFAAFLVKHCLGFSP